MLVLSRKKNEKTIILLGNGVIVECTVVEIRGDKVRLGWNAPKDIPIHREEVFKAILREGKTNANGLSRPS